MAILTIELPDLHPGQQRILESDARFKVVSAGRRFGKTMLSSLWLGMLPGSAAEGAPCAFFAPTYKLLLDVWNDLERTLAPITKKASRAEMRLTLTTGGRIDFWTLEDQAAGRGRKYKRIVIDEAAHARYLQEAWQRAIAPTLTDYEGEAWFISTPNGLNYFYDLYQRGTDPAYTDWASFHMPTTVNPFMSPMEIERARGDLPELVYRQEYEADFVTFGAGLVKPSMLIAGKPVTPQDVVLGVDLAISEKQGADFTAIAALSRDANGVVYIREIERHRVGFHETLELIQAAAARWKPSLIAIEQTQYQAAVVQELARKTTLPVRGIHPDRDKVTRFAPLLTRFEQGLVRYDTARFPDWARDEILSFPEGKHDDGVDALAHAFNAIGTFAGAYAGNIKRRAA